MAEKELGNDFLASNDRLGMSSEITPISPMSYEDFMTNFLFTNKPCVFNTDVTKDWRCRREWSVGGAPNFKIIRQFFGDCVAPIANCKRKHYNSQFKDNETIANYLDYWIEYRDKNYPDEMSILYLKDWHCVKQYDDLHLYEVPEMFSSDWLNEYYTAHPEFDDDYMFVYMGPKGTWTPFHADVFASYSWSANIVGKKKWLLFPPGEEKQLRDSHGQLPFDVTSEEMKNPIKYPNYNEKTLKSLEIIQEEGEIMFVPSGWHHQVWNLEDTISVNHNWINGHNVLNSWQALKNELSAVMREVEDCRDMENWDEHCQLMLKVSHGMNYSQFYQFLSFIVERRLKVLTKVNPPQSNWQMSLKNCLFDVSRAKDVLIDMIADTREKKIDALIFPNNRVNDMINDITALNPSILD